MMKTNTTKLLALLLALLLCLPAALLSCQRDGADGTEGSESESQSQSDTAATENKVLLADGSTAVRILYSLQADESVISSAKTLGVVIEQKTGTAPKVEADRLTIYDDHDSESVEILVGATSYEESGTVLPELNWGDWYVGFVGKKLVVNAHSTEGVTAAVTGLVAYLGQNVSAEEGKVALAADFTLTKTFNEPYNLIPNAGIGELKTLYPCGDGSYSVTLKKVQKSDHEAYLAKVEEAGFTKYTESTSNENQFTTYTDSTGNVLTAMYTPDNKNLTLVIDTDKSFSLPILESENTYDKTVTYDTTLTQVGLCYDLPDGVSIEDIEGGEGPDYTGGLLHIFRLEDGSFLIVDSGHQRESGADLIYETLKKQAPDPDNIVIAAWILSHTHSDHIGGLLSFAPKYADKVTVEQFVYNFPFYEGNGWNSGTRTAINTYFPDAKRVKAHAGQRLYVRNAVVEMLYSFELIAPYEMEWFNESSLAFTVTAEGQKTTYLTDIGPLANQRICEMYGASLDSDLLQVAHHGWDGGSYRLNELVRPEYVLFNGTTGPLDKHGNDYFMKKVEGGYEKQEWILEFWRAVEGYQIITLKQGSEPTAQIFETHEDYLNAP